MRQQDPLDRDFLNRNYETWIDLPPDQEQIWLSTEHLRFRVLDEEWTDDYTIRTIKQIEIL